MRRMIIFCFSSICAFSILDSCYVEDYIIATVKNEASDTILARGIMVFRYYETDESPKYPFEFLTVPPQDSVRAIYITSAEPQKESFTFWIINKKSMGNKTIEEVLDGNLLDSVKTYVHTYSYQDLRSMNFQINVDESLWE